MAGPSFLPILQWKKKVSSDSFAEVASRKLYSYETIQQIHSFYRENYLQCYIECNFEGQS